MTDIKLKQEITACFKLSGFAIRKDANAVLIAKVASLSASQRNELFNKIIVYIQKQELQLPIIEKEQIELALKDISSDGLDELQTIFNVIDVFDIPKFTYNSERQKFIKNAELCSKVQLYSTALRRSQYLIDRYNMILQRTLRNKLFVSDLLPGLKKEKVFNLKYVENLLSSSSKINEVIVLGLISQLTEGTYYLEDLTGAVALDLTDTRFHSGLFTEHCFVLAEGYYDDKILHVMGLVMPPLEPRDVSQIYYGNTNTFGGSSKISLKNSDRLLKIEKENQDNMMVFLSDVWLDNAKVMEKLKSLFTGFNSFPPMAIVFMGDFLSRPYGYEENSEFKAAFKSLGDLISQFDRLSETCKFIFVPTVTDIPHCNILPRPPLFNCIVEDIKNTLGDKAIFTSNPCRIQYCTQEIVVLRHNLVTKMCRNSIRFPETGDIPDHMIKTLLSQCTLCPLSIGVQPVYWQHADALNLYPTPDLVVIADHFQPYTRSCQNCQIINPGSFPRTDYSFKVYFPSTKTVEDSQIPEEED